MYNYFYDLTFNAFANPSPDIKCVKWMAIAIRRYYYERVHTTTTKQSDKEKTKIV